MLYTSYFANLRNLPPTVTPIGICAVPPRWFTGTNCANLAPSLQLLSDIKTGSCTMLDYWDRYWDETLKKLNPASVYQELLGKGSPDVALCCYETPASFCHRHILSYWFNQNLGVTIREYGCDQTTVFGG